MQKKALIIVPAYNEEGNIKKTIHEINHIKIPSLDTKIIVINDGSTDNTLKEILETNAKVISLPFNLGIGGAVQTGFKFAQINNFDFAIQVDGDGQHDISYLQTLLKPLLSNEADMSIGSRFIPPNLSYRSSCLRRVGILFFSYLISFLTKQKVTDPTSGFRAYNKEMIEIFARYYPHDYPEPEAISVASRFNTRIVEVPVIMRQREAGHSSIRYLYTLYYMVKVTFAIILDKLKLNHI